MGIVKTMAGFGYIECDADNCRKKIEHNEWNVPKQLAKLCGWENIVDRWLCPECLKKDPPKPTDERD